MTLPELCDCNEKQENTMPANETSPMITTSTTTSTTTPVADTADTASEDALRRALKAVLQQGAAEGRVTCSLTSCVELLSTRPDDVMLCVMPVVPHADVSATIQSTLIRAVCQEHSIRVLAVDCDVKLAKAVCLSAEEEEAARRKKQVQKEAEKQKKGQLQEEEVDANCNAVFKTPSACSDDAPLLITGCDNLAPVMGFPCVLVQYPTDGTSTEDEVVAEFCKELMFGQNQQDPYLELPD